MHQFSGNNHVIFYFQFITCSVAGEPCLEEWVSRAELCDMLHDQVGSKYFLNLKCIFFFVICCSFFKLFIVPFNLQVRIAMVGKYTGLSDAYLSVIKVTLDALNP